MLGGLALELCFPALFISTSFISAHEGSGQPPLCPSATSVGQVSAGGAWPQCQSKAFQSTSGSKLAVHKYICFPPVVLHTWLWVWEERTRTTGQETMTQQRVKRNYNERCWALAWDSPWKVAAKAGGEEWDIYSCPFFARHLWQCWWQKVHSNDHAQFGLSSQNPHDVERGGRQKKISPCNWKKVIQTWGYDRRHLLPLVTFTEELCMGPTQNSSTSPEPMADDYIEMTTPNLTDLKDFWHQWRLYKSEDCWTRSVLCFPHSCCHPSLSPQ